MIDRVAQFQIDSVTVVVRAQRMPLFSRLGSYDDALLSRAAERPPRRLFEYWGHAASLIDVQLEPVLRHRMAAVGDGWPEIRRIRDAHPGLAERILAQIERSGPLTARQIDHQEAREPGSWWNWSQAKHLCEWLFASGRIAVAGRTAQFERRYDLAERVLPGPIRSLPTPGAEEADQLLVERAARALGVATLGCLADYFRTPRVRTRRAVDALVASGQLRRMSVDGWTDDAFLWHEARIPRRLDGDALVSPFDSLVFERRRLAELFGVHYRIGLYTPAAQRSHGYYVYLFVMDERVAARVDLKADRPASSLVVRSAWLEPDAPESETAGRLAVSVRRMASWLGLESIRVDHLGTLQAALRRAVAG